MACRWNKSLLRMIMIMALAIFVGGASGTCFLSYGASPQAVEAEASSVAAAPDSVSEESMEQVQEEEDGMEFILVFMGGILLLILFVVIVSVSVSVSSAGISGDDED